MRGPLQHRRGRLRSGMDALCIHDVVWHECKRCFVVDLKAHRKARERQDDDDED